ncbi:hypothetical protein GH714_013984 [Hevea brasiliensis]|uniref:Uncharacterized protein n=1 Tax=Hevea brasiliensis TaxID=3981 RepID=A0A6A6KZZ0_HEVBR|nr:hypothetical protein GH714_013984 [Hevea brasiliensis]
MILPKAGVRLSLSRNQLLNKPFPSQDLELMAEGVRADLLLLKVLVVGFRDSLDGLYLKGDLLSGSNGITVGYRREA